jgi:parallel beta-helix repeat protein
MNPDIMNPEVANKTVTNPDIMNPDIMNPDIMNPDIMNPDIMNGSITDTVWTITNNGNTASAYNVELLLRGSNQVPAGFKTQLILLRTYTTPVSKDCQLMESTQNVVIASIPNPRFTPAANYTGVDPTDGSVKRATLWLAPGETGKIVLRVVNPNRNDSITFNAAQAVAPIISGQSVNTDDAAAGSTTPPSATPRASIFLQRPTDTPIGGPVSPAVSVLIQDDAGNAKSGATVTLNLVANPGGATPHNNVATTVLTGVATFPNLWFDRLGSNYQLVAVATLGGQTFTSETSAAFDVTAVTPVAATLAFTVQPADATASPSTLPSVAVQALDATASPVPGVSINVLLGTTACSAATLPGSTTVVTDGAGIATFSNLVIDRGGWGYALSASVAGNPVVNVTSSAFNVEGFCDTGSLATGRGNLLSAPLLPNGKVLLAGGAIVNGSTTTATAELFDPAGNSGLGSFAPTGSMNTARHMHEATLLADGRVLVSGGQTLSPLTYALSSAEIYDPTAGAFAATGSMSTARAWPRATLLHDGRVLVTGGGNIIDSALSSAELFDPASNAGAGSFTPTGSMGTARTEHTATTLLDGRVLVSGGNTGGAIVARAEVYDPATGTFSPTGAMGTGRHEHTSTLLPDGRVLITGGRDASDNFLASAELFDPSTGSFSPTGAMGRARVGHASTLLPDGTVLITGGTNSGGRLASAEIFDAATGTFGTAGTLAAARYSQVSTLLPDGKVLVAGGFGAGTAGVSTAELFFPLPPTIFLVTNTSDSGAGSLRQAILDANAHPGLDAIHFNIPGPGVQTISPASALPDILDPVLLDATTQPGYAGTPLIRLDGASLAGSINGIAVQASNSLIRGLAITRFPLCGISVANSAGTRIESNYVGTDSTNSLSNLVGIYLPGCSGCLVNGNVVSGNTRAGISLSLGTTESAVRDNRVGTNAAGTLALGNGGQGIVLEHSATSYNLVAGNLVSGNGSNGIVISAAHHTRLISNKVGTDALGTSAIPNSPISVYCVMGAHDNVIGGSALGDGNLIAFNSGPGLVIDGSPSNHILGNNITGNSSSGVVAQGTGTTGATVGGSWPGAGNVITRNGGGGVFLAAGSAGTVVQGNWIGTDAAGTAGLGNTGDGVIISSGANGNTVSGNLISGNSRYGVGIFPSAHDNVIEGNQVGTDAAGNVGLPNLVGVAINAANNTVRANLVSGNSADGIDCGNSAAGNLIENNRVGTNAGGTAALGKQHFGIQFFGAATTANRIRGNLICGNDFGLLFLDGAHHNAAVANKIGTDLSGASAIPNGTGVQVEQNAHDNLIGGSTPADRNLISGNGGFGISIAGTATNTIVVGNLIGTDAGGTVAIPNALSGVSVSASNNVIGDPNPPHAAGNVIAFNGSHGIEVHSGTQNEIISNRIFSNGSLGIFLGPGANDGLNAPVIASAVDDGTSMAVVGTVNIGDPNQQVWLDFFANAACDPSGYGEGQILLGHKILYPTDSNPAGVFSFTAVVAGGHVGQSVTATARTMIGTRSGDTSQFSACSTVSLSATPVAATPVFTVQPADATSGQTLPSVVVEAVDGGGNPVPGVGITMTLGTKGCSAGTLSGTSTVTTGPTGIATFPDLVIDRGGWGYTLKASVTDNPAINATSSAFNVEGFCDTGSLGTARAEVSAPLLPNGKVLFAGGINALGTGTATAELFDPSGNSGLGSFAPTGSMGTARMRHTATLLLDGRVLIAGGRTGGYDDLASAEIYDPTIGTFAPTGSMSVARVIFGATLLTNGNVLITGGGNNIDSQSKTFSSTELFDPSANSGIGSFALTGSMGVARTEHAATLLADGRVLVSGGRTTDGTVVASAEIYDPATGTFSPTSALGTARHSHGATLLPSGKVLITGGAGFSTYLASAELFDPATGTFSPTGAMGAARSYHTSTLLPDGKVLVSGGTNSGGFLDSAELFDPVGGTFGPAGNMSAGRRDHGATLLPSGKVLIGGGVGPGPTILSGAELFFPLPPTIFLVKNTADAGAGSLRQAILDANAHAGLDAIHFDIPGSGVHYIILASALPPITDPVILDATTQPGFAGTPVIVLYGSNAGSGAAGIVINAGSSTVRGLDIYFFLGSGMVLNGMGGNRIEGNFSGTDPTGTVSFPNSGVGLAVLNSMNNIIGGTTPAARNVISGNSSSASSGVLITGDGNVVQGNFVGTDASGTVALANGGAGVFVADGRNNLIGGTMPGAGNIISGNYVNGITVDSGTAGTLIVGNKIGTNEAGTAAVGNAGDGIGIYNGASGNTVSDNIICASTFNGVRLNNNATGNTIRHNWVGTNAALAPGLGNANQGISVSGSPGTMIGGMNPGDGNVVAYNVQGGIGLESGANNTLIQGNVVSGNTGPGVGVLSGTGNAILSNSIIGNTGLGIDLGTIGVTPNDPGDTDNGANDLINFPVLTSAVDNGSQTTVAGSVDVGTPGVTLYLQFFANDACDSSGYGEGQTFVGSTSVVTGGGGTASFSVNLPTGLVGKSLTATTNTLFGPGGNTSEFSACAVVIAGVLITEVLVPTANSEPYGIASGPDGALWFTEYLGNRIGRITTAGVITEFPVAAGSVPLNIAAGPDGNLWFTENSGNRIARITTAGVVTEFPVPTASSFPGGIAAGPDGSLWFTENNGNKIGRITTAGVTTEYSIPSASSFPSGIAAGPDGALWFTEYVGNRIGRITTTGVVAEFPLPTGGTPAYIVAGPDGNLWFTEFSGNKIGRISTAGVITEFPIPTAGSLPIGIAVGPDGALWFTEHHGNKIGRITTAGVIDEFPVPTTGCVPFGIAAGSDGALWFTEAVSNQIGRLR